MSTIQGLATRVENEPVNALVLGSLFRSSLKLVGLYKNLMSQPGFQPTADLSTEVSSLVTEGQKIMCGDGDPLRKIVTAVGWFVSALRIEPRAASALSGLLKSAEQLSAVSWERFHAVPPELRESQRQLDDRQQLVEALLAPDRGQPERILPGAPRRSFEF